MKNLSKSRVVSYVLMTALLLNGGSLLKVLDFHAPLILSTFILFAMLNLWTSNLFSRSNTNAAILFVSFFLIYSALQYFSIGRLSEILSNQDILFIVGVLSSIIFITHFAKADHSFSRILTNTLTIVSIHALIGFLIFNTTQGSVGFEAQDGRIYYTFGHLFYQRSVVLWDGSENTLVNVLGFTFRRAHGIFWEPSVFSTYMNIFLFLSLFVHFSKWRALLATLLIVLSWSTTGLIVFAIQILYYLYKKIKFNTKGLIIFFISLVPIVFGSIIVYENLSDKIIGTNEGSTAQRFIDTMSAVEVISQNPILGIGLNHDILKEMIQKASPNSSLYFGSSDLLSSREEAKFSNSLLSVFMHFGLLFGGLLIYSFFKQTLIVKERFLFAIINLLAVSAAPILLLGFHLTFMVSGLISLFRTTQPHNTIMLSKP